jgi:HTH-type transcriptional regulator, transcriptional repressor of NAD biosynthesis genes
MGPLMQTGLILGTFLPPHRGHQMLIDFATPWVDHLTILVTIRPDDPISGDQRLAWLREMYPHHEILPLVDDLPLEPHLHPDFWQVWHDAIRALCPHPTYFFASERYGWTLAEVLGATFVPVDLPREAIPISGRAIRQDPLGNWDFLAEAVRPFFVRRVTVIGPPFSGKSTLAAMMGRDFQTTVVPDYPRRFLEQRASACEFADLTPIVRGQAALTTALSRHANRVLISDTDVLSIAVWAETHFGECPPWIIDEADRQPSHLTLLCEPEPSEEPPPRGADEPSGPPPTFQPPETFPEESPPAGAEFSNQDLANGFDDRWGLFDRLRRELELRERPFIVLGGPWETRVETARRAIENLLATPPDQTSADEL